METGLGDNVAVDTCHLDLVRALVKSHKPSSILELGVGSGRTTIALCAGIKYNESSETIGGYQTPKITLVDNWNDWGHKRPDFIDQLKLKVNLVESDEKAFIFSTRETYDFIFSDADHWNTDKWFDYVYDRLLNVNGILIYHDVSVQNPLPDNDLRFPNLENILIQCKRRNIKYMYFDKCSLKSERCFRGLLVIYKSEPSEIIVHNGKLIA